MADQDDDDPELKQLKQLRQVWLAMPDEEPPTRGLDALMAAARTKAEAMQPAPEPWWKRMFATMVRPPALALATIVVVAFGAVLVNRHHDELDATSPVIDHEVQAAGSSAAGPRGSETAGAPVGAVAPGLAGGDQRGPSAGSASATPQFGQSAENGAAALGKAQPDTGASRSAELVPPSVPAVTKPSAQITHEAVTKKPAPPRAVAKDEDKKTGESESDDTVAPKHIVISKQDAKPTPKPEPAKVDAPTMDPTPQAESPRTPPADGAKSPPKPTSPPAGGTKSPPKPTTVAPTTRAPAKGNSAQLATDNEVQNAPESVESMLRRAHEAAARGDCATAKVIAAQIANRDIAFYRSAVAKDVAVAKCLPVAAE